MRFPQKLVRKEATAHANLAMNPPDRQWNAFPVERFFPGEHMLIDAIDECPVEVEQK